MAAGRPRQVDPGTLYAFAHQFYWDFRRLVEGGTRWRMDEKAYKLIVNDRALQSQHIQLSDEDRSHHERSVEEEIRTGRLAEWVKSQRPDLLGKDQGTQKEARLRDIEDSLLWARQFGFEEWAADQARKTLRIPGEPDAMKVLLDPNTKPEQVRELCKDAFMTRRLEVQPGVYKEVEVSAWPISAGSPLPTYLSQYAEQFVAALRDPKFPRCDVATRPSTRLKQLWFLSRALAGALFGVTTRTAINLVGSMRPEEMFHESRDGKPARRRMRKRIATGRH